jgi:hypothetical protein
MKTCSTCGMPLEKKEDFAGGDENAEFCLYCVNADGSVKSCAEIFEGGVQFFLGAIGGERAFAEKIVRKNMNQLPYWENSNCACLQGEQATDAEFASVMEKL